MTMCACPGLVHPCHLLLRCYPSHMLRLCAGGSQEQVAELKRQGVVDAVDNGLASPWSQEEDDMLKALVSEMGKGYWAEVLAAGGECFHERRTPARSDHLPSMPNHTPRLTLWLSFRDLSCQAHLFSFGQVCCLVLPQAVFTCHGIVQVSVKYLGLNNQQRQGSLRLFARCLQHRW